MKVYKQYDDFFKDGAFSNYLSARIRAQAKVGYNKDLVGALRYTSSNKLVEAVNGICSQITGIDSAEILETLKDYEKAYENHEDYKIFSDILKKVYSKKTGIDMDKIVEACEKNDSQQLLDEIRG